jgi:uncharacterized protein YdaU (DUF1376 family)
MAPEARPAFLLYPADFLSDLGSAMMTLEQRGAFITLLCHAWIEKGLPESEIELARLLRLTPRQFARTIWPRLASRFHLVGGRLVNLRLEAERARQDAEAHAAEEEQLRVSAQRRQAAAQRWRR